MKISSARWPIPLLVAGLIGGILGESLLFFRAHLSEAEKALGSDLKILVFLEESVDDERATVIGEKLTALEGTERAVFVSPEEALARIEARDPTVFRSVAVMGENPLPGAFEVDLRDDAIGSLPVWAESVRDFVEVDEVVFKPLQVRALMQMRFYERFANMSVSLAAACASLWIAWCIMGFIRSRQRISADLRRELALAGGVSLLGALIGLTAAALLAGPASQGWISGSVSWLARFGLILLAGVSGAVTALPEMRGSGKELISGRERRRMGAMLAAASLLLPSVGIQAATVRSKRRELKKVTKELEQQKKAVSAIRREKNDAQKRLKRLTKERRSAASRVDKLKGSFRKLDDERLRLDAKLDSLSTARSRSKDLLGGEVEAYRRASERLDSFYESGALWEEALRRAAIRDKALYLAQLRIMDADSLGARNDAVLRVESIQKKASREIRKLDSANSRLTRTRRTVATVSKTASTAEKRLKSLESSARELASLIRDLTKRSASKGKKHSTKSWLSKASLPWPVLGQVVERFGKRRVPKLKTWTIHNGITIAARKGAAVHPVRSGTVIFAGPFRSYGNVIIINHSDGFYSIYGHLKDLLRKKGARVGTRTPLASVGDGRLYLEFRQGGKAFDPSPFLRSGSVSKR